MAIVGQEKRVFIDPLDITRKFVSTEHDILEAMYIVNRKIHCSGKATVNYLYEWLGIDGTNYGEILGWTSWVDYMLHKDPEDNFKPIEIVFTTHPVNLESERRKNNEKI